MPGTPDPLLGSAVANWAGAVAVALVLVAAPLRYRRTATPRRLAVASGVLAAVVGVALWAIPRLATGAFGQFSYSDPVVTGALYVLGVVVLGVQVAGPTYAYRRYGLVSPLVAAVAATTLSTFLHFQIGGESESFALYVLFSPVVLGAILALAVLESGARRLVAATASPG